MALDTSQELALGEVLRTCVVRVSLRSAAGAELGHGTAFFVGPGRALTCQHVVEPVAGGGAIVLVTSDNREFAASVVTPAPPAWADLALLEVVDGEHEPCVVFDVEPVARNLNLLAAGFPDRTKVDFQQPGVIADGYDRQGPHPLLRVKAGQLESGMSGGPTVNLDSGLVCGVTRTTKNREYPSGGFVIPVDTILEAIPVTRGFHDRPGPNVQAWVTVLGAEGLSARGREPDGSRVGTAEPPPPSPRLDLVVTAADTEDLPRRWTVKVDYPTEAPPATSVGLSDLGDDVIETLDRWSRRRTFNDEDEVDLLGRVLRRALLPDAVADHLRTWLATTSNPVVRVEVHSDRMAVIPWEYTWLDDQVPIGASADLAFARYVDVARSPRPPLDALQLLVVSVCPPDQHARLLPFLRLGSTEKPPTSDVMAASIAAAAERDPRVVVSQLVDPDVAQLRRHLEDHPVDVVHYVGFGLRQNSGEVALAVNRRGDVVPMATKTLVEASKAHGPFRALVVHLLVPPPSEQVAPLPSASLHHLLDGVADVVIATQHPAPFAHVQDFTDQLYDGVAAGDTLEQAVQTARRNLRDSWPLNDSTAFGMFTITTTMAADHQLMQRPVTRPAPGDGRPSTSAQPNPLPPPTSPARPTDVLHK